LKKIREAKFLWVADFALCTENSIDRRIPSDKVAHSFVLLYEEPTLRKQFGGEYDRYGARVPCWIPKLKG